MEEVGMRNDQPFPPPFGVPMGPSMSTPHLVAAFVAGAQSGSSPDAHIEEPVLMASDHPLAVRLDVAVLVRGDVPPVARSVQDELRRALRSAGIGLVEEESVLADAVAMTLGVPRGFEWDLWASDPAQARDKLVQWALE